MNKLIPLINIECNTILIHIIEETIGSSLLISNINLFTPSLGFWYVNMYAENVSISKLIIINWKYVKGGSLFKMEVIMMISIILMLIVNSNSTNLRTFTIIFLPYRIAFIKISILPSRSTRLEASIAENDESAPIFTPTSAYFNTEVSSC